MTEAEQRMADRLRREAIAIMDTHPGASAAMQLAADFLDQCAEAEPVAWLHDVVQDGDEPDEALSFYPDSFPLENVGGFRSIGCKPLYAAPVPPQAEPKREPLSDDDINKLAWKQNLWTDHMIEFSFLAFAREVERAHGIGGSDEC